MTVLTQTDRKNFIKQIEKAQRELLYVDYPWLKSLDRIEQLIDELHFQPARRPTAPKPAPKQPAPPGYEFSSWRPHPDNIQPGEPGYEAEQAENERLWRKQWNR